MGCSESRDYTADAERLTQCQDLAKQVLEMQQECMRIDPSHDLFDNTSYTMWASKVQELVLKLRGESGMDAKDLKKSKRQTTLAADELENLILWVDKAKYEMAKTDNVWLDDSELDFIQTMKTTFIGEVNNMRKHLAKVKEDKEAKEVKEAQ